MKDIVDGHMGSVPVLEMMTPDEFGAGLRGVGCVLVHSVDIREVD